MSQTRLIVSKRSFGTASAGRAWVETQEILDQLFKTVGRPARRSSSRRIRKPGARRRLRHGQHDARRRAAARSEGPLHRHRHIGADDRRRPGPRRTGSARRQASSAPTRRSTPFEPASFDMIISRFGVMFFEDSVRAFANLRRAATDDADIRLIAWRSAAENPFMTTAERAAAPLLPNLPARRPDAPGQFAFADRRRVHTILEESGWAEIDIRPDRCCLHPTREGVGSDT